MPLNGKLIMIGNTQSFGNNGFTKREVVIETKEEYPQKILIEFIKDKCEILDKFSLGDQVSIDINLRGREWVNKDGETKYFNSLQGWRIVKHGDGTPPKGEEPLPF